MSFSTAVWRVASSECHGYHYSNNNGDGCRSEYEKLSVKSWISVEFWKLFKIFVPTLRMYGTTNRLWFLVPAEINTVPISFYYTTAGNYARLLYLYAGFLLVVCDPRKPEYCSYCIVVKGILLAGCCYASDSRFQHAPPPTWQGHPRGNSCKKKAELLVEVWEDSPIFISPILLFFGTCPVYARLRSFSRDLCKCMHRKT